MPPWKQLALFSHLLQIRNNGARAQQLSITEKQPRLPELLFPDNP